MGLPKGRTNNPYGRPKLKHGRLKRLVCIRLNALTHRKLRGCCRLWRCGTSEAVRRVLTDEQAFFILHSQMQDRRGLPVSAVKLLAQVRRQAIADARARRRRGKSIHAAMPIPEFMTEKELAGRLHVDRVMLRRMRRKGLPFVQLGRVVRYPREGVALWLSALKARNPTRKLSPSGARALWDGMPKHSRRKR